MNQPNLGNSSDASPILPVKRKRGRPRKDQSLNRVEAARVPPGFEVVNGNLLPRVDSINSANDSMVGQTVTGVVEAAFDAGYLLAVKIGNSDTCLRGVVFKPGHYAPVTAENDVAPHVQMIRRNETHLSKKKQTRVRGINKRSRERNMQLVNYLGNGSPPANQVLRAPSVPPVGARGTVVPVILQPVNLSNGLPPANQAAHMTALKGKHVQTVLPLAVYPPNGSTSQALPTQPQTSPQMTPTGVKNDKGPFNQGTTELQQGDEAMSMKSNNVDLQGEGGRSSSQSSETHTRDGKQEQEIGDMNEPLFIEPLQTRHFNLHSQAAPVSKPVEDNRNGRMSELLQALQENLTEEQVSHVEHRTTGAIIEFHEPKIAETRTRDEKTVHAQTHSQAASM